MRRLPAALALVLAGSSTVQAGPCAPRVELAGDPAAVARVGAELARLGVTIGAAAPGCEAVQARVQLEDGGVAVAISDSARRSEGRVVSDVALAATWLESWARDDIAWIAPPSAGRPPAPSPAAIRQQPAPEPRPGPSIFAQAALGVSYEQSFTNDAAWWSGFGGHGCVALGGVCAGARVRYAEQSYVSTASAVATTALGSTRSDLMALATVSTSFDLGRMTLAPELGAGIGRYTSDRAASCLKPPPDPTCDPAVAPGCAPCGDPLAPVTPQHAESYAPRLAAAIRIAVPLFDHVWLDGLASLAYGPLGHIAPFTVEGSAALPPEASIYALPGEPRAMLQLGVGLRIGAP